jgi:hypothetical protein
MMNRNSPFALGFHAAFTVFLLAPQAPVSCPGPRGADLS